MVKIAALIIFLFFIFLIVYTIVFSIKEKIAINKHEKLQKKVKKVYRNIYFK